MSDHLTDEEQVEKVKAWLKENGMSIVAGVVIALGGIFGLQYWRGYQADTAAAGGDAYDVFLTEAAGADVAKTRSALEALRKEHAGTAYVGFAALELARQQAESGDLDAARQTLEGARQEKTDTAMASVIDLRLARILMAQEKLDEAGALLAGIKGEAFAADVAGLRGQIAYRQGNLEAARTSLKEAQDKGARDDIIKYLLEELQEQT